MKIDSNHIHQIALFKFNEKKTAAVATKEICAIYPGMLTGRTCRRWFQNFRNGQTELGRKPGQGRPIKLNNDLLQELLDADPSQSSIELAIQLHCHHSTVIRHLHQLGKVKKQGIWVPYELSANNKNYRVNSCLSHISRMEQTPFLNKIVTGDEKWVVYNNVKRKKQWLSRGQTPLTTPK